MKKPRTLDRGDIAPGGGGGSAWRYPLEIRASGLNLMVRAHALRGFHIAPNCNGNSRAIPTGLSATDVKTSASPIPPLYPPPTPIP